MLSNIIGLEPSFVGNRRLAGKININFRLLSGTNSLVNGKYIRWKISLLPYGYLTLFPLLPLARLTALVSYTLELPRSTYPTKLLRGQPCRQRSPHERYGAYLTRLVDLRIPAEDMRYDERGFWLDLNGLWLSVSPVDMVDGKFQ